ncbi:tail fiber domain-containing protein [bacterium]|nr:tail fiber domain-containing protein [bacterium]
MKKIKFKNCIAFTLMEMTLVLLITSVIAAASTPIITSAVSDASKKNGPSPAEAIDIPWKVTSSYDGGGIYNTPYKTYSFLSVGHRPGAMANSYKYPALLVSALSSSNIAINSQILIAPNGLYNNFIYSNIAMDEFENVKFTYGNSLQDAKSTTAPFGYGNVFIGDYIQNRPVFNKMFYRDSVFMGYSVNTGYAINSVNIGSDIYGTISEVKGIHIGSNQIYSNNVSGTMYDNIHIGNYAGTFNYGNYNIFIGHYAGYASAALKNIMIGPYAGYNFSSNSPFGYNYGNIIIGQYAGYTNPQIPSGTNGNRPLYDNIIIGKYAGTSIRKGSASLTNEHSIYSNVMIGEYAGYYDYDQRPRLSNNNIMIGYYAGYASSISGDNTNSKIFDYNNIFIGNHSGAFSAKLYSNVLIGDNTGSNFSNLSHNIFIGNNAGARVNPSTDGTVDDSIAIGAYAGYNMGSSTDNKVFIGYQAGNGSLLDDIMGIGPDTCNSLVTMSRKICLGSGTFGANNDGWHPTSSSAFEMIIGFTNRAYNQQTVTLYASKAYSRVASLNSVSDRRLKTNIVPSMHSLKDIRRINIYNFNMKDDINKTPRIGIIAQEYRKVFPHDVVREPNTKKLAASANWLIYTMVNAIKDLDKSVEALQNDFNSYASDFSSLQSKITNLEKQAEQIRNENAQMREHLAKINAKLK